MRAHGATATIGGVETIVMGDGQFYKLVIYLVLSAVCLVAAGVINYNKCRALEEHMKTLEGTAA